VINAGSMVEPTTISTGPFESLQKAFGDFQFRAERLQRAYDGMREDFKKVNVELDRKNSELRQSLAVQEEMQTYLHSILESMDNGVIGVNVDGVITHFNRAAAEITGYDTQTALGRPYLQFFTRNSEQEPALLQVLRTGKALKRDEKVIWRIDGHPVPVSFQTELLTDSSGASLGAVEIFSDISKIKALEGEMQQAKTMAALGEMSAAVAHEIRNPLGAMGMWAGLLERDLHPGDTRSQTLKKIIEGLSRLNKIVTNLLVYTRPVKTELRKVPIEHCLEEVVDFVDIEVERLDRKIAVRKEWEPGAQSVVLADPEKMEQVVMNLCLNAIQAMPDGGTLTVAVETCSAREAEYVCFSIRDTGVGIEKENLTKIFDPFFTTKENGTGLGLAIVKKFVEFHAGYIDVKSRPEHGTTVRIFLPKLKE
jgi:PAS domain S-box-containing protein